MQNKAVLTKLITKAVQGTFEPQITKRYLREFNFGPDPKADDVYALALKFLNQGETEICVSYVIAALDVEKDHNPTFHLAKTMLFSLSEEFEKSNGNLYKQKHADLNKYLQILEKNIAKLESDLMGLRNNLKQLESETGFLQKMKNKSRIAELQAEIPESSDKLDKNKKEIKKVSYLSQIEEYTKILSLILEVITFPSRYSWVYKV
jgi:predicted RNase H-like nuclease (RuvC/YqgF family)